MSVLYLDEKQTNYRSLQQPTSIIIIIIIVIAIVIIMVVVAGLQTYVRGIWFASLLFSILKSLFQY